MLGLFYILCFLLWAMSLFLYFLMDKYKYTKYYGTISSVKFFKTSKQYRTLLVVKTKFENRVRGGKSGKVIARLSAILPEMHLKKHINHEPEIVIEQDGSRVQILYLDFMLTRVLMDALRGWFSVENIELAIKASEVEEEPRAEEREYALLDIHHFSMPNYEKEVSNDDFVLIFCQNPNFSIKIEETILENVEAYIKITSDMLNRPITAIEGNNSIKKLRLHAFQLEGIHENDERLLKWIGIDTFCKLSHIHRR